MKSNEQFSTYINKARDEAEKENQRGLVSKIEALFY